MTTEKTYGTWTRVDGITVDEVDFDGDAHAFEIYLDGNHVISIYSDSAEQTKDMRASLDAGEDVRGWEDGEGNCVGTLIWNMW